MIPRETLLDESTLDILVPNGILNCTEENVELLFTSKARAQTFYDEVLHSYLILCLPYDSSSLDKSVAKMFFQNLEVSVDASLVESSYHLSVPKSNYRFPLSKSSSSSTDTSPSIPGSPTFSSAMDKSSKIPEGTIIHSIQFNTNQKDRQVMVIEHNSCWTGVIPVSFPIVFPKTRVACPMLALNATVTLQSMDNAKRSMGTDLYSANHFGGNLLAGLDDDPDFESEDTDFCMPLTNVNVEPKHCDGYFSMSPTKRTCRTMLPVKTALNVRMRTTNVSPLENSMMISISVENNNIDPKDSFLIESIKVNVSHGFVTRYECVQDDVTEKFPLTLNSVDQATFLYNIAILEKPTLPKPSPPQYYPTPLPNSCTSSRRESVASIFSSTSLASLQNNNDRQRPLTITIVGTPVLMGERIGNMKSKWNCMLDLTGLFKRDDSAAPVKSNLSDTTSQRTLSLNSRYGSSQVSSPRSSVFLSTGITTPTTASKSINYAIMSGHTKNAPIYNEIASSTTNGILPGGRALSTKHPMEVDVGDGVMLSFSVSSKVVVGKVFSVQVFIINKSKSSRKFTIFVHNKKRRNDSHNGPVIRRNKKLPIEPFMDENEFLVRHSEFETPEADIICLDNNVQIGPLRPSTCESVTLHFIAMKESLHPIDLIQLVDSETGYTTNLRNVLEITVPRTSTKRESKSVEVTATVKRRVII